MVTFPVFRRRRSIVLCHALLAAFLAPFGVAAIRSVGKYNGVVLYDRWDNCYLFSGVYLMYVSDGAKETLRPFRGRSVEIDAKEVYQPINPGDGLIKKLNLIGESKDNPQTPSIRGIDLLATVGALGKRVKATMEIRNNGPRDISVDSSELGFAVIAHETPMLLCPSDGTSCAVITRANATGPGGRTRAGSRTWAWKPAEDERLLKPFLLHAGDMRALSLVLDPPRGSYEFVAGYGGGVHEGPCVASNSAPFEI